MAGSGRISVFASRELQTLLASLKQVPREVRKNVRAYTKKEAQNIWQAEINSRVQTRLDERVLGKTARVAVSDQNVMLQSARIGKSLQHGVKPSEISAAVEFGRTDDAKHEYVSTSRSGKKYKLARRTKRQLPSRNTNGRIVFPSARKTTPRLASLWYQTAMRTLFDHFDK